MLPLTDGLDRELTKLIIDVYIRNDGFVFHDSRDYETYIELYAFFFERYEKEKGKVDGSRLFDALRKEMRDCYGAYEGDVLDILEMLHLHYAREERSGLVSMNTPKGGFTNVS